MFKFIRRMFDRIFKIHSPHKEWINVPNKHDDTY